MKWQDRLIQINYKISDKNFSGKILQRDLHDHVKEKLCTGFETVKNASPHRLITFIFDPANPLSIKAQLTLKPRVGFEVS
jgi:hypothetical protein